MSDETAAKCTECGELINYYEDNVKEVYTELCSNRKTRLLEYQLECPHCEMISIIPYFRHTLKELSTIDLDLRSKNINWFKEDILEDKKFDNDLENVFTQKTLIMMLSDGEIALLINDKRDDGKYLIKRLCGDSVLATEDAFAIINPEHWREEYYQLLSSFFD